MDDDRSTAGDDGPETEGDHGEGRGHHHGDGGTHDDRDEHGHGPTHGDHHAHDHDHGSGHHHAHDVETVGVGVVTVSSSRSIDDDPAGDAIVAAVESAGHEVSVRELIPDDYDGIQQVVDTLTGRDDVDVVVTTGGTGVTPDDVTVEAVDPLFEKGLPGFGELFRRLSYDEIGTMVVGTRAVGGIADGVPVFCLPGSENAARLGVEEIVVHEASHLAGLARRRHEGDEGEAGRGDDEGHDHDS